MRDSSRARSRMEKVGQFLTHAVAAARERGRLGKMLAEDPIARAIVDVADQRFSRHELDMFREIRAARRLLEKRRDTIQVLIEDPLDPDAVEPPAMEVVGPRARARSIKEPWGQLLYALARELRPVVCLELGACMGVSGLYIQAGLREGGGGRFVSLEGSRAYAEIAAELYESLGFQGFELVVGDFDRQLAPTLERLDRVDLGFVDGNHRRDPTLRYDAAIRAHSERGVIVHDDIRFSRDMEEAWQVMRNRPGVRTVFDLFRMGILALEPSGDAPRVIPAWLGRLHFR